MIEHKANETVGVYTLAEFITAAKADAAYADNADALRRWLRDTDDRWMGLRGERRGDETHADATARLSIEGWRKGVELMADVMDDVTAPTPRCVRRVQRWGRQGDDVEMQRIWAGDLDTAWRTTARDNRNGPARVRLLVDSIAHGMDDADEMRWRGVAALRLADVLTEAGYSVQVEAVMKTQDGAGYADDPRTYIAQVIVKDYTAPADLPTLAACTALPAFFRSLMHTWGLAQAPDKRSGVSFRVRSPEVDDFDSDGAPVFMIAKEIDSAAKATQRVAEIINTLDAGE